MPNIWATGAGGISILSPKGKLIGRIELPEVVANLAFADDGKTVLNENNITPEAWLQKLRDAGYADAKMNKRCVIVGALVESEIPSDEVGSLVQINLSPQSKIQFDRYIFRTAYDLTEGAKTEEETLMIDLKAVISKNGKNTYTSVQFAYAKA